MLAFYLLWSISLVSVITELTWFLLDAREVSSVFLALLFVVFFPFAALLREYIESDTESTDHHMKPSLVLILLFVGIVFSVLILSSPSALGWISLIIGVASLLSLLDTRYNFAFALLMLSVVPVLLIIENKELAEQFSIITYYSLVWGVVSELSRNIIQKGLLFLPRISFFPSWWAGYIKELHYILHLVLQVFPWIFSGLLILIITDTPLWRISFHADVLSLITVLAYISLLVVPYRWKWDIRRDIVHLGKKLDASLRPFFTR